MKVRTQPVSCRSVLQHKLLRAPQRPTVTPHDEYEMWDAAYVLGSLSSTQRREFEAHKAECPLCRSAVGELTGMPALLLRLDRYEVAVSDESDGRDRKSVV